jgi:D-sedoheptulose 7-phosphate isomerase
MLELISNRFSQALSLLTSLSKDEKLLSTIRDMANICYQSLKLKKTLFFIGNGGSASVTEHLVAEFVTGEFPIRAYSLVSNSAVITALSNDYKYEDVFVNQIKSLGEKGDVLLSFSCSGESTNIIKAVEHSNILGLKTISFSGFEGSTLSLMSNFNVSIQSNSVNRIQEAHLLIGHILYEIIVNKMLQD